VAGRRVSFSDGRAKSREIEGRLSTDENDPPAPEPEADEEKDEPFDQNVMLMSDGEIPNDEASWSLVNWKGLEEPYGLFSELVCDIWGLDNLFKFDGREILDSESSSIFD
jgi:hypothetical protein